MSLPGSRRSRSFPFLPLLFLLQACAPGVVPPAARSAPDATASAAMRRALAAALQARGDTAVAILRPIDPAGLDDRARSVRACMLERLGDRKLPPESLDDPFVRGVLGTYEGYWLGSIRDEAPASTLERRLLDTLNFQLSAQGGSAARDLDGAEEALGPMLEARGYHSLMGVTSPLRELMLWRSERTARFDVALPQGIQTVTVVFMDDFASLGWAGFATCDRNHTGGWTKPDRLYAVQSAYDTTKESFRVSYLAHEGQHFWDTSHLSADTPQDILEYRAKLVELALGQVTEYDLLAQFTVNSGDDPAVPHAYANGRVIHDLRARLFPGGADAPSWREVPVERLNAAAAALLREDIARRTTP